MVNYWLTLYGGTILVFFVLFIHAISLILCYKAKAKEKTIGRLSRWAMNFAYLTNILFMLTIYNWMTNLSTKYQMQAEMIFGTSVFIAFFTGQSLLALGLKEIFGEKKLTTILCRTCDLKEKVELTSRNMNTIVCSRCHSHDLEVVQDEEESSPEHK